MTERKIADELRLSQCADWFTVADSLRTFCCYNRRSKSSVVRVQFIHKNRVEIHMHVAHYRKTTRGQHLIPDMGLVVGRVDKNLMRPSTGQRTVDVGDVSRFLGKTEHCNPDENNISSREYCVAD
jgi:hypothetical protein